MIPDDWDTVNLGAIVEPSTPIRYGLVQVGPNTPDGIPIIPIKHLQDIGRASLHRAARSLEKRYARSRILEGDVLLSVKGTIGQIGIVPEGFSGNIAREIARIRVKSGVFPGFIAQQLAYDGTQQRILRSIVGTTRQEFSIAAVRRFEVALPKKDEQRAIAEALGDVDALLGALDRLIAKKRDLKQAAMQQLLTGQTRLPGFDGEWSLKRFGQVLTICHGKNQHEVEVPNGDYPILATGGQIGTASRSLYDKPSVLIGRKGTINQPRYMATPFWTVDTLFYSEMKGLNTAKFFYYRFCLIDWMQFNEASGVPSLNARTIESIEVAVPEPCEQLAISGALSDMDAELEALGKRRAKTAALKQGMMQELLTGRTRLV